MKKWIYRICLLSLLLIPVQWAEATISVQDMVGREVVIDGHPERIICLAPGTLRLITYLGATDALVGVEAMEKRFPLTRPYWLAHPELNALPTVGPGGPNAINNDPDLEAVLSAHPDLIFITYMERGKADQLQKKLGIPVVVLSYGPFGHFDERVYDSLALAGTILGRETRATAVIHFIESCKKELLARVEGVDESSKPGVYIGAIGFRGTQGIGSTEAAYAPFEWVRAHNMCPPRQGEGHLFLDKEALLSMDPSMIFIDGGGQTDVIQDIQKNRSFYQGLTAFREKKVYILHSYNWYMTNIGTAISDAYTTGKILYPDRFQDISLADKADEIYTFLVGQPVYRQLETINGPLGGILSLDRL